jgi:hypothetical protein
MKTTQEQPLESLTDGVKKFITQITIKNDWDGFYRILTKVYRHQALIFYQIDLTGDGSIDSQRLVNDCKIM